MMAKLGHKPKDGEPVDKLRAWLGHKHPEDPTQAKERLGWGTRKLFEIYYLPVSRWGSIM